MAKKITVAVVVVILAIVGVIALVPTVRIKAAGWARGETFHRGMPLSYWLEAIEDPNNGNLRYEATLAVARDPGAIPALRRRLQDPVPLLRNLAAAELGSFGPKASEAVPDLVALLKDEDRSCREAAADALARIDPKALPAAETR
jgi:hypothetical protein